MGHCKKVSNIRTLSGRSSGCVYSLQFKFEWQEGLTAVGDLQQCFCHYNNNIIVQPYI